MGPVSHGFGFPATLGAYVYGRIYECCNVYNVGA